MAIFHYLLKLHPHRVTPAEVHIVSPTDKSKIKNFNKSIIFYLMRWPELQRMFEEDLAFQREQIANFLQISKKSAQVLCFRYVKRGLFIKLGKNLYTLEPKWKYLTSEEVFKIANLIVPSYVSLLSALSYYGISTQVPQNYYESVTSLITKETKIKGITFRYFKVKREFLFGFRRENKVKVSFLIALPEKAFLDAIYLMSFGRYALDLSAIDMDKFDRKLLQEWIEKYPEKVKRLLQRCNIL